MKCPICGKENDYDWPVYVNGTIHDGGCQECWEQQSDAEWWKTVRAMDNIING